MDKDKIPLYRFLGPRFWLIWCGLGFLRIAIVLPYGWQLSVGRAIGRLGMRVIPTRRLIAQRNLELCFPELSDDEKAKLLRQHFESLGIALIEGALCWWASDEMLEPLVQIEGLEHVEKVLERGKGAIMLTGHFAALDLGGRILTTRMSVSPMYRPHRNPLFDEIVRRGRARHSTPIPKANVKGILRALKHNDAIWYAPDQSHRRRHSANVPFFSVPAPTNTATSTFARASGAGVLPFFPERLANGKGYRLVIRPPLEDFPGSDPAEDAARINRLLEQEIRRIPEQYLWVHRRFKSTGPDDVDHYADIRP